MNPSRVHSPQSPHGFPPVNLKNPYIWRFHGSQGHLQLLQRSFVASLRPQGSHAHPRNEQLPNLAVDALDFGRKHA